MQKFGLKAIRIFCLLCFFWGQLFLRSPYALAANALADNKAYTHKSEQELIIAQIFSNLRPETPLACAVRPSRAEDPPEILDTRVEDFSAARFRQGLNSVEGNLSSNNNADPPERIAPANPTNYGDRFFLDIYGNSGYRPPIIVLHETVATVNQTLNFFQTPHRNEAEQASYHTLISLAGEIIYIVPPDKRAFGAGNSIFANQDGEETVRTNPNYPPSVNNFAYHVSLESPRDGLNNRRTHSGYTEAQYRSLAWLVAKTGVTEDRITTHQRVDRSGQRIDPRSFDYDAFLAWYQIMPKDQEIFIGCAAPPAFPQPPFVFRLPYLNEPPLVEPPTFDRNSPIITTPPDLPEITTPSNP